MGASGSSEQKAEEAQAPPEQAAAAPAETPAEKPATSAGPAVEEKAAEAAEPQPSAPEPAAEPAPKSAGEPEAAPAPKGKGKEKKEKKAQEGKGAAKEPKESKAQEAKPAAKPAAKEGGKEGGKDGGKAAGRGGGKKGEPGVQLCVRNLTKGVTPAKVRGHFEPYGTVMSVQVKTDQDGNCRGFGFVTLSNMDEANKAITGTHNKVFDGKQLIVVLSDRQQGKTEKSQGPLPAGVVSRGGEKGDGKGKGKVKGKAGKGQATTTETAPAPAAASPYPATPAGMLQWPYMMPPYGVPSPYMMSPYGYGASPQASQMMASGHVTYPGAGMSPAAAHPASPYGFNMYPPPQAPVGVPPAAPVAAPAAPQAAAPSRGKGKATPKEATTTSSSPPISKEFTGCLKSLSAKNGFGFIACKELKETYSRDAYVDAALLPQGVSTGDWFRFSIELSEKGHPRVKQILGAQGGGK